MSRKSHYNGGGTLVGPQNQSWFGHSQPKKPRPRKRPKVGLLAAESAEFKKTGLTPNEVKESRLLLGSSKKR